MRKNSCLILLALTLALILTACQTTTPTPTSPPANTPTTIAQQPTDTPLPANTATPAIAPPTITPLATSTATATPTNTPTPTQTPTNTPSPSPTATNTLTPTSSGPPAPPPTGGVTQPPYGGSCGDYPCPDDQTGWEERLRVPTGFQATYFAHLPDQRPTSITFGPDGQLYVATMSGTIYRLDNSGNASTYVSGFLVPTGIAFQPGTDRLFVSSRANNDSVNGESIISVVQGGGITRLIGGLPCCYTSYHAANGIAFGPDGFGYVSVGARADHGEKLDSNILDEQHPLEAAIVRFSTDGSQVAAYAHGLRNSYDITWDGNGRLFATDNAPDFGPPEELHQITPGGQHGYPWYDCDECFPAPPDVTLIPPKATFIPHSSPTGIIAYLHNQFPGYYNSLFVTLWSAFPGAQKVVRLNPGGWGPTNFATGFASPIDLTTGPDGSLYVADWATGVIFRISYTG
ncbi:MAG TPA: PQQ-dependent sugar dehydrogenase [Anaerolineae bacterium]|nr:PQQ-dependent sugar dehydrogenase [Anaerolineae bacterium]